VTHEEELLVQDLSMIVRMLVRRLQKHQVGEDICERAMEYLKRKGLEGSVLRCVILPKEAA